MIKKKTIIITAVVFLILAGTFIVWNPWGRRSADLLSQLEEGEAPQEKFAETTLTFLFSGPGPQATQEVVEQIERKLKNTLNIKLNFKFNSTIPKAGGSNSSAPTSWDVFYYQEGSQSSMDFETLVKEGMAQDITKEFPRLVSRYYHSLSPEELNTGMVDGKIYGIPPHFYGTQMRAAIVREDLMAKYQIPEIKNYDDYEEYMRIIKAREPKLFSLMLSDTTLGLFAEANGYLILDYTLGLVYPADDPDPKIIAWEQTPAFQKGLDTLLRWSKNGYLRRDIGYGGIDDQVISSGKWASFVASFGTETYCNEVLRIRNISWRYKAYPLNSGHISARNISPGMLIINSQSKNSERVLRFINWLQSKQENYDLLMFGVKGKHYQLDGERIKLFEEERPGEISYYWVWHAAMRNIDFERFPASSPANYQKEYRRILENNTKYSPFMGFKPELTTLQTISRQTSFDTIERNFIYGSLSPDDVEKYIQDQKRAGVDQLVAEVQRQFDKWKETR